MAAPGKVRTFPGRYAKFLTALAGNALVFASVTYGSTNRWVELATAAAAAFGVLAVPNTAAAPQPPAVIPVPVPPAGVTPPA